MIYGGVEAGGTKIICCRGDENGNIIERARFKTTEPKEDIGQIVDFFKKYPVESIGLGWFGPLDLNPQSEFYGTIGNTPKLPWKGYDILGVLKRETRVPVYLETDVNAALLGECTWGAAKGARNAIYITIGTGIGAGILVDGKVLQGMTHPEAGHIMIQHPVGEADFEGVCPYHGNRCFEGVASGPAIEKRWGRPAMELVHSERVWELEASYIGQALYNYIVLFGPEKIILGGGVMEQKQLFPLIRKRVKEYAAGYIDLEQFVSLDEMIVPAGLNGNQGLMGSLKVGMRR